MAPRSELDALDHRLADLARCAQYACKRRLREVFAVEAETAA
jgi:hypothetical protein